jgi:phosphoribosylanthranilate isomerase
MHRTRVKFCGFTQADDLRAALDLGVDLIGLNLARGPRRIDVDRAASLASLIPPGVSIVALFVDADAATILDAVARLRADAVQLHGDEPPELAQHLRPRVRVIRAARIAGVDDLRRLDGYPADALLLDAAVAGAHGGTGARWDLSWLDAARPTAPFLLAGGLTAATVAEAVRRRPWAVDASSGIESAPGRKDPARMREFLAAVAAA